MSHFGEMLKYLRKQKSLTQVELGSIAKVSRITVSLWERGLRTPRREVEEFLANFFGVSLDVLRGIPVADKELVEEHLKLYDTKNVGIPLVECKTPKKTKKSASGNISVNLSDKMDFKADCCFVVTDNSMSKSGICAGDVAFVCKTDTVECDDIAAVVIEGKVTLRHVLRLESGLGLLVSDDMNAVQFSADSCDDVRLIGKVVYSLHPYSKSKV